MIRFVVGPDGSVVADIGRRLPGRGFWLSAERDMVNTACAKNLFARAAKAAVKVPPDLADRIEGLLARRCLDLIGLARRSGQAIAGFEKVSGELGSKRPGLEGAAGKNGLLLFASDGAEDGQRKIRALAPALPEVNVLSAAELGVAFGRDRSVHVFLAPGRLASALVEEVERLKGFR